MTYLFTTSICVILSFFYYKREKHTSNSIFFLKFHNIFIRIIIPIFAGIHLGDSIIELTGSNTIAFIFQFSEFSICLFLYFGIIKFTKFAYWCLIYKTIIGGIANFISTWYLAKIVIDFDEVDVLCSLIFLILKIIVYLYYRRRKSLFFPKKHKANIIVSDKKIDYEILFCRFCGKQIPADSQFCPNCGSKIKQE